MVLQLEPDGRRSASEAKLPATWASKRLPEFLNTRPPGGLALRILGKQHLGKALAFQHLLSQQQVSAISRRKLMYSVSFLGNLG